MTRAVLAVALVAAACAPRPRVAAPAPALTRAAFRASADALVGDPMFRNANWGVLILDPATGDTLYSRNAAKLFMPASNQKILTGATALAQLGGDFRFATHFVSSAPVVDGVLRGDLVVVGQGDPTMSDAMMGDAMRPLRAAADSLWALGIRAIAGALVKGGNLFPDTTLGFGWEWDDFETPSGAAVDELFFNNGVARVTVFGGDRPGDPVRVRTRPARSVPVVAADLATGALAAGDTAPRNVLRWTTDVRGARPVVHLTGFVRPRDSVSANVALRDPASAWLDAFAEALADRGIALHGNVIRSPHATLTEAPRLLTLWSPPLREILPPFLKPSQNQIGELLLHTLGLLRAGVGRADSGRAVIERQLAAWGADTAGFAVRDGSGLSRHDYVSPETIVRVLDAMRTHQDFRVFYDALPIAGVDGTIATRMRGTPAERNVHAKTGTVDKARSLSGFVTTADGRLLIFSFLCNNFTVPNREVERVQDAILARLAGAPFLR
ncbi:MAG TPA: D-alanyl-D-alanine carboxypeptidase/D-alanyl-D-alanine-endopeptidase [Gemmatimonadaceae bacterium]|nr:D-alanyl-D-alanine carboxypeptidase/D-alanyl-D-alanine-endopeptidase [Gemmatimonadaceae bacterium]